MPESDVNSILVKPSESLDRLVTNKLYESVKRKYKLNENQALVLNYLYSFVTSGNMIQVQCKEDKLLYNYLSISKLTKDLGKECDNRYYSTTSNESFIKIINELVKKNLLKKRTVFKEKAFTKVIFVAFNPDELESLLHIEHRENSLNYMKIQSPSYLQDSLNFDKKWIVSQKKGVTLDGKTLFWGENPSEGVRSACVNLAKNTQNSGVTDPLVSPSADPLVSPSADPLVSPIDVKYTYVKHNYVIKKSETENTGLKEFCKKAFREDSEIVELVLSQVSGNLTAKLKFLENQIELGYSSKIVKGCSKILSDQKLGLYESINLKFIQTAIKNAKVEIQPLKLLPGICKPTPHHRMIYPDVYKDESYNWIYSCSQCNNLFDAWPAGNVCPHCKSNIEWSTEYNYPEAYTEEVYK